MEKAWKEAVGLQDSLIIEKESDWGGERWEFQATNHCLLSLEIWLLTKGNLEMKLVSDLYYWCKQECERWEVWKEKNSPSIFLLRCYWFLSLKLWRVILFVKLGHTFWYQNQPCMSKQREGHFLEEKEEPSSMGLIWISFIKMCSHKQEATIDGRIWKCRSSWFSNNWKLRI